MFTLFHLFQLLGALFGLLEGTISGMTHFGWVGLIIGAPVGLYAGFVVGGVPGFLAHKLLLWDLKRTTTEKLKKRLADEYFLSHLIIGELACRGEAIEEFRPIVIEQLKSPSSAVREYGEINARIWFPDLENS